MVLAVLLGEPMAAEAARVDRRWRLPKVLGSGGEESLGAPRRPPRRLLMDRGGRGGNSEANSDGKAPLPIGEAARDGARAGVAAGEARVGSDL